MKIIVFGNNVVCFKVQTSKLWDFIKVYQFDEDCSNWAKILAFSTYFETK